MNLIGHNDMYDWWLHAFIDENPFFKPEFFDMQEQKKMLGCKKCPAPRNEW